MRRLKPELAVLIILSILLAGPSLTTGIASPSAATVSINPSAPGVSGCNTLDVYVDITGVTGLYALDLRITFNPAVVEVVDADLSTPSIEIEPVNDPGLNFKAGFTVRNDVNNAAGTIWYVATQTAPSLPAAGSGHVAHIRLRARNNGSSPISLTDIQLATRDGEQITASAVNGVVVANATAMPALNISRLNASQVQLSWPAAAGISQYLLYRSTTPYFNPAGPAYRSLTPPDPPAVQSVSDSVLGNAATNYFYTLRAQCNAGGMSGASDQVGKFEYELYETTDTDYTWIALPLAVSGLNKASTLAAYIQNNSSGPVSVLTLSNWNNQAQSFETYFPQFNFGDFNLAVSNPYQVEIDIPGVSSGSVVWSLVGALPPITADAYTLIMTSDTDYNWLMQPLDLTGITTAANLSAHIQANSSGPVSVLSASKWNPVSQSFETYFPEFSFGDFTTRFGYPYQVEVAVQNGSSVTWP